MTQKLFVKTTDENGKMKMKEVIVIRSWQESNGTQIYLHADGTYGYKDASPIMGVKELDIIGDKMQRKAAIAWWDRVGQRLSQEFYQKQEEIIEARLKTEISVVEGDASNLDSAQYIRRPINDRSKNAWSDPSTWFEWFEKRPEWWGYAPLIEIGNHRYKMIDLTEEASLSNIDDQTTEVEAEKATF